MHLDGGGPVLEFVALRVGGSGQQACLRTGTKPEPSWQAAEAARMNPRASIPTTLSTGPCPLASALTTAWSAGPSASSGVMSLNTIPGLG